jgi:hypothetical protein
MALYHNNLLQWLYFNPLIFCELLSRGIFLDAESVLNSSLVDNILDLATRWLAPICTAVAGISGFILFQDLTDFRTDNPTFNRIVESLSPPWLIWLFFLTSLVAFLSAATAPFREKRITPLRKELEDTTNRLSEVRNSIRPLFDGVLLTISKRIAFEQNDQTRISIYLHRAEANRFVLCGRYSPNPKFRKPGRPWYPDDQGCIAKGWEDGWHFDKEIPTRVDARRRYHRETYGIPDDVFDTLEMPSKLIAAIRLSDSSGNNWGVVVVEAKTHGRFQEDALRRALEGECDYIADMIRSLYDYIPVPSDASERGL